MITMMEFTRSAEAARASRLIYEDMALVAHLSELERKAPIANCLTEKRPQSDFEGVGAFIVVGIRRVFTRFLHTRAPRSHASAR